MAYTNIDAVEYARKMLGLPYWYGTFGQIASESLYKEKKAQYPAQYPPRKWTESSFVEQYGKKVHDCAGLAWKGFLMTPRDASNYPYNAAKYNSKYDYSANGMMELAKEKGNIGTMPEIIGLLVWKNNHVGIYAGKGADGKRYVYEAQGHAYGVTRTVLEDRNWQMWLKCPFFDYVEVPKPTPTPSGDGLQMPELRWDAVNKKATKCDEVTLFQLCANNLGYRDADGKKLVIDGSFGSRSECVCIQIQRDNGILADGICGNKTWTVILHKRFT